MLLEADALPLMPAEVTQHGRTPASAVRFHDVTVRARGKMILNALSLTVPRGVVAGIVGPNGAGKTTTFRVVSGLIGSFTGSAEVLGHPLPTQNDHVRALLGVVPERDGLYDDMRVEDILNHWARLRFPNNRLQQQERTHAVLLQMKLWERRKDACGTLSAGLRRRVAIARALLHNPSLLLLDEVTNGLDIFSRQDFYEWLAMHQLQHPYHTVLFASHNTAEVARLCNFFVVLRDGEQLFCGPRDQLVKEDADLEAIDQAFLQVLRS